MSSFSPNGFFASGESDGSHASRHVSLTSPAERKKFDTLSERANSLVASVQARHLLSPSSNSRSNTVGLSPSVPPHPVASPLDKSTTPSATTPFTFPNSSPFFTSSASPSISHPLFQSPSPSSSPNTAPPLPPRRSSVSSRSTHNVSHSHSQPGLYSMKLDHNTSSSSSGVVLEPVTAVITQTHSWNRYLDPVTSCFFYYNKTTGETSWHVPKEMQSIEAGQTHLEQLMKGLLGTVQSLQQELGSKTEEVNRLKTQLEERDGELSRLKQHLSSSRP